MDVRIDVTQVCCEKEVILEFARRSERDLHEPSKVTRSPSTAAFCQVRTDRGGAASDLRCQTILFLARKGSRYLIEIEGQSVSLLPHH